MKCDLSACFLCFSPFMAQLLNVDSHDHVISLMGLAFNEAVLLDIDR